MAGFPEQLQRSGGGVTCVSDAEPPGWFQTGQAQVCSGNLALLGSCYNV